MATNYSNERPTGWWYSGSNCLAALMWLVWFAMVFLMYLNMVERDWANGLTVMLVWLMAVVTSAMGWKKQ